MAVAWFVGSLVRADSRCQDARPWPWSPRLLPCDVLRSGRGPEWAGKAGVTLHGQERQDALRTWDLCLVILGSQAVPCSRLCFFAQSGPALHCIARTGSSSPKEEQRKHCAVNDGAGAWGR